MEILNFHRTKVKILFEFYFYESRMMYDFTGGSKNMNEFYFYESFITALYDKYH